MSKLTERLKLSSSILKSSLSNPGADNSIVKDHYEEKFIVE